MGAVSYPYCHLDDFVMAKVPNLETDFLGYVTRRLEAYKGDATEFERSVGAYVLGLSVGWKPLLLIHDRKVVRKYGDILGVDFKKALPEVGPLAHRSLAWKLAQKVSSFWKAAKGEIAGIKSSVLG